METHDIDSIFRKAIHESGNFYDSEANDAKERIWNEVQGQKQSKPFLFRLLVAACILLFFSTTVISISNIRNRTHINSLVELNKKLEDAAAKNNNKPAINKESAIAANVRFTDTIYIEKKVIVNKPIVTTQRITDTVYIKQMVYIEKEQTPELLTTIEIKNSPDPTTQTTESHQETEIIISNNEPVNKKKRRKLQIKFGGNKNQASSETLAFNRKL